MSIEQEKLVEALRDREFRDHFAEDQVYELLTLQIRRLREKGHWTQGELGAKVGMGQSAIARVENPDYTGSKITTLSKLARAFDVALIVRFAPFTELTDWLSNLSPDSFEPAGFEEETLGRSSQAEQGRFEQVLIAESPSNISDFPSYKGRDWRVAEERPITPATSKGATYASA